MKQVVWVGCVAFAMVLGCGDDSGGHEHEHEHGTELDHTKCTGSESAWALGSTVESDEGHFRITLVSAIPDPPVPEVSNEWVIKLTDKDDNPLDGATFDKSITFQHVHKHEGAKAATVTGQGADGLYDAKGWDIVHPGSWEFRMAITHNGTLDSALFHFCVADATDGEHGTDHD